MASGDNKSCCPLCTFPEAVFFWKREDRRYAVREYRQCPACRLTFLSPACRLEPSDERAVYSRHENGPDRDGYVRFLEQLADPLCRRLPAGACGLDFGSGPGPALNVILEARGFETKNFDPFFSPDRELLKRTYDFVACTEVVEHFFNPREEFLLLNRLMKPGSGLLGIMTRMMAPDKDFSRWWYHRDPTHVCFYQRHTFEWIAGWMGWRAEFPRDNVVIYVKTAEGSGGVSQRSTME